MTVAPARAERAPTPHRSWLLPLVVVLVFLAGSVTVVALAQSDVLDSSSSGTQTSQGSGVPAAQVRHVPPFRRVVLAGSNDVRVRIGRPQAVVVHADDNLVGRVTTEVGAATLTIGDGSGSIQAKSPRFVAITVPSIDALTLDGSGSLVAGGLQADELAVRLGGSGTISAHGTAQRLQVTLSGSGVADVSQLVASHVTASIEGAGLIVVHPVDSLDAAVPGAGEIVYVGTPAAVTKSVTGEGSITAG